MSEGKRYGNLLGTPTIDQEWIERNSKAMREAYPFLALNEPARSTLTPSEVLERERAAMERKVAQAQQTIDDATTQLNRCKESIAELTAAIDALKAAPNEPIGE